MRKPILLPRDAGTAGEIVGKKVFIELEPNLSSCIETLAKREYKKALSAILKTGTEDEELSERLEVLRLFLESTDFGALRSRYEKYLEEGKRVKFRIYFTKGKVSYKLVIQTQQINCHDLAGRPRRGSY
jgi:hypothetical protein